VGKWGSIIDKRVRNAGFAMAVGSPKRKISTQDFSGKKMPQPSSRR
jgi:hypothetical protein